jgi:alkylation response protein AidB-like acyl-CoA dehydrogenase
VRLAVTSTQRLKQYVADLTAMLTLTQEQQMLVDTVSDLAESEFADDAYTWDGIPWENVQTLADYGFMGLNFDEDYGGGGMTEFEVMLVVEAIGQVCPDTSEFFMGQHMIAPRSIDMFGSDVAKERYLPPIIDGELNMAVAMSEPGAGSDLKNMVTTVEEADDGTLVLNGEKMWMTNGPESDSTVVWAKFPEGFGLVIIDMDQDGVEVNQHYTNMAGDRQTHFFMNDVEVDEDLVLIRGEEAFKEQLKALNWERLGSSIQITALARNALDQAISYTEDRVQFDQSLNEFQGVEWKLANMTKEFLAARTLTYTAAQTAVEQDRIPDPLMTTVAKLHTAEAADMIVDEALQLHGANGYQQGHPLEYLYRFVRGHRIAGGTDEIMQNQIAKWVKRDGLPSIYES